MGGVAAVISAVASAASAVSSIASVFSKPKTPSAPAAVAPIQPVEQTSEQISAQAEEDARRATLARVRGRTPTVLTSTAGVGDTTTTKKTLLGA